MVQKRFYIPKIIHQIWLGPKERPKLWMDSWKEHNPDWEYKLWTEDNLPILYNQKQFDTIQSYAGKADIARVEILYRWGGIYIDADCECLRSLENRFLVPRFFACYENELTRPGLIQNSVIGSIPGHPLLKECMRAIEQVPDVNGAGPWTTVGPFLFTKVVRQYEIFHGSIKIFPSYTFSPIHYEGACYYGRGRIYATHHWSSTTGGKSDKDLRFNYKIGDHKTNITFRPCIKNDDEK
jgi:mannosyltransferase OCH1-like enzyme